MLPNLEEECLLLDRLVVYLLRYLLDKWRGRAEDVAILIIVHGRIEAFSVRLSLESGEKLLLHV